MSRHQTQASLLLDTKPTKFDSLWLPLSNMCLHHAVIDDMTLSRVESKTFPLCNQLVDSRMSGSR